MNKNYFDETTLTSLTINDCWFCYYNQYNEELEDSIPAIDMDVEIGIDNDVRVFKFYIYKNNDGSPNFRTYFCMCYDNR